MTSTTTPRNPAGTGNDTVLTVGSATVRYRVSGSGPALLLVHGTGAGSVTWDRFLGRLTDHHTVILPDLSGSDPVRDDGGPLALETLTAQLAAVVEHAGLGAVDAVGHSLGAITVLAFAAARPDLVRRLVPVAGYSHGGGDDYMRHTMELFLALADRPEEFARYAMLRAFSRGYVTGLGRSAADELARGFVPTPDRVRQLDLVLRADVRELLPRIEAPTLVIGCAHDGLVPVEHSRGLHAAIAGSRYAELDSGHVVRAERPGELVAVLRDFLA